MEKEWIEKHIDDMVQDICKLSEIPSVSVKTEDPDMPFGQACLDALHAALDLGRSMGFETFNHENYCGTLLWKGESDTEIGFFGHADVVPAGNGWTCCEPFKPVVKDGLLIGRGVSDNKGSFMTALYALKYLKEQGYEVTILPVDHQGVVKLEALEAALRPDTILVSVMYVNNEVGAVMPVEEIGKLVHEKSPKALFHVDAIQAFGKYRIYPKKLGIDLLSVSSHKIHGPKGVGFLYINEKVRVQPQILGGGQQNGMRSGTDNVPGIAGLGVAAEMVYTDFDKKIQHLYDLKERMAEGLSKLGDITVNGMPLMEGAPHIMSVTFHGVRSEVLLHTLEEFGVYISAGSACSSHKRKPSATLTAIGLSRADVESTVRISFCEENTFEEVDYCLEALGKTIPMLRRYARR